jgi:hypothetical protein
MPNIATFKMQNPPAIPAFFALSSQKSPTRFHQDPKKIAEITADKTISKREKRELVNEYEKRLKTAQPIQYPSNIELVRKYYDQITMSPK